jgi:hypothetical protein
MRYSFTATVPEPTDIIRKQYINDVCVAPAEDEQAMLEILEAVDSQ